MKNKNSKILVPSFLMKKTSNVPRWNLQMTQNDAI